MTTSPRHSPTTSPSVPARLCFHAAAICRALDEALTELQRALHEVTDHTDAVLEIALALHGIPTDPTELDEPLEAPAHATPQQRLTHLHHGARPAPTGRGIGAQAGR